MRPFFRTERRVPAGRITNEEYQRVNLKYPIGVIVQKIGNAETMNIAPTMVSAFITRLNLRSTTGCRRR